MINPAKSTATDANQLRAEEGSTLYYALLYIDDQAAKQVLATFNFVSAMSTALHEVREPQVAEKKIHWWHEELARLAKRSARHPACVAVQPLTHGPVDIKESLKILSASSNERYTPYATDEDLNQAIQDDFSARLHLVHSALQTGQINSNAQQAVALGLAQFHRLDDLVKLLRHGYSVFSDERYAKHKLTPEEILSYSNQATSAESAAQDETSENTFNAENCDALLVEAIEENLDTLQQAVNSIRASTAPELIPLPIQVMCEIRLAQVKLWKKRKPNLLKESLKLTPLKKFFIAYKCKRWFTKTAAQ